MCACGCGHCGEQLRTGLGNTNTGAVIASAGSITSGALGAAGVTAAIPLIGPAVAGVTLALGLIFSRKGPQQKIFTTRIVDEIEPHLKENLRGYMEGPRTRSSQLQALANFDAGWAAVLQGCGQASMGNPGINCINDRKPGGQWDWFAYYRDPIAQDAYVKPDPTLIDSVSNLFGGSSGPGTNSLIPDTRGSWVMVWVGALLLVGAFAGGSGK